MFHAVSTVSRMRLISTGIPILSCVDPTVRRNLGSALSSGNGGWGKRRRCQCFSVAHYLVSESEGEGPQFPRCQELSGVPRSGQVWRVGTTSLRVAEPEFLPGPGQPTPHPPFGGSAHCDLFSVVQISPS